jgi:N-acetylneuraminic acid mutarotase
LRVAVTNNEVTLASAELYDPDTNTWSPAANLPQASANAGAVLLQEGPVLVIGGNDNAAALLTAELYW